MNKKTGRRNRPDNDKRSEDTGIWGRGATIVLLSRIKDMQIFR